MSRGMLWSIQKTGTSSPWALTRDGRRSVSDVERQMQMQRRQWGCKCHQEWLRRDTNCRVCALQLSHRPASPAQPQVPRFRRLRECQCSLASLQWRINSRPSRRRSHQRESSVAWPC